MSQVSQKQWYETNENLADLIKYMAKDGSYSLEDVAYMIEKPWKFETIWEEYQIDKEIDECLDAFDRRDK